MKLRVLQSSVRGKIGWRAATFSGYTDRITALAIEAYNGGSPYWISEQKVRDRYRERYGASSVITVAILSWLIQAVLTALWEWWQSDRDGFEEAVKAARQDISQQA